MPSHLLLWKAIIWFLLQREKGKVTRLHNSNLCTSFPVKRMFIIRLFRNQHFIWLNIILALDLVKKKEKKITISFFYILKAFLKKKKKKTDWKAESQSSHLHCRSESWVLIMRRGRKCIQKPAVSSGRGGRFTNQKESSFKKQQKEKRVLLKLCLGKLQWLTASVLISSDVSLNARSTIHLSNAPTGLYLTATL